MENLEVRRRDSIDRDGEGEADDGACGQEAHEPPQTPSLLEVGREEVEAHEREKEVAERARPGRQGQDASGEKTPELVVIDDAVAGADELLEDDLAARHPVVED